MKKTIGAAALLVCLTAGSAQQAQAQDALIGGILGGAAGAAIGGAVGGSAGAAVAGGIIGGATGAMIGSAGERRRGRYYAYERGCYIQVGHNRYRRAHPRNCY